MALVRWRDDMSVGDEALDQEHRRLFAMINELYEAIRPEAAADEAGEALIASVLDRLVDYAREHFAREEARMAECGFPGLVSHRAEHVELAARVFDLRRRFLDGSLERPGPELLVLFKTWLASHVQVTDARYRPYIIAATRAAGNSG